MYRGEIINKTIKIERNKNKHTKISACMMAGCMYRLRQIFVVVKSVLI